MSKKIHLYIILISIFYLIQTQLNASVIKGKIVSEGEPLENVNVYLDGTNYGTITDKEGGYLIDDLPTGKYMLTTKALNFSEYYRGVDIGQNDTLFIDIDLTNYSSSIVLEDVVVSGTMKPIRRLDSPVPVEVYSTTFFKKSAAINIFGGLQNINGVRPQINCNVCNTGDIHINGLEGAYTIYGDGRWDAYCQYIRNCVWIFWHTDVLDRKSRSRERSSIYLVWK